MFWLQRIALAATRIAEAQELRLANSQVMQEQANRMAELLRQLTEAGNRISELEAAHNVLTDNYFKANEQRQQLRLALEAAVKSLRARHGANWDLYYRNAPELTALRAVLGPTFPL